MEKVNGVMVRKVNQSLALPTHGREAPGWRGRKDRQVDYNGCLQKMESCLMAPDDTNVGLGPNM